MRRKKIFQMTIEELQTYPTKRLLARLKRLHQCEQTFELSDKEECERNNDSDIIEFKETLEWQSEYQKLKETLKTREHVSKL